MNTNKRKAVVVTDNYIEFFGVEKALDLNQYWSKNIKSTDLMEVKARLIVVVLEKIDRNFLYICRENCSQIIPTPMLVILKNKREFRKLDMKKLKIDACIHFEDDVESFNCAIEKINAGEKFVSESLEQKGEDDFLNNLTRRQYEICLLTANGYSTKEVSDALEISEKTVRNQISLINKSIEPKTFYQAVIELCNKNSSYT